MSNQTILSVASSTEGVAGTVLSCDGGQYVCHIMATSYGSNGKVILQGSCDGITYTTLNDPNQTAPTAGKAEYSADTIVVVDKLSAGWKLRASLVISSGTATVVKVIVSSN